MNHLVLPVPPTANRYWRNVKGVMVRSREAKDYINLVKLIGIQHRIRPLQTEVFVTLRWYRAARRGDLDNRLKVALDALAGVVYDDDSQIAKLYAERIDGSDPERLEVEWREVEAA